MMSAAAPGLVRSEGVMWEENENDRCGEND
jgi:hypothetical protein